MKKLFVIDFDGTIVSGHTHNTIIRAQHSDNPEYVNSHWGVVHDFPIIGLSHWQKFFAMANQQRHYLAIASFNSYGSIIPEFLEKIGLTKEMIEKIHLITGLPADLQTANKNEYIQQAIEEAIKKSGEKKDFSGNPEDVFLIDDSRKNLKAASEKGYQIIHAKKDASHLNELQEKLGYLSEEKKPPVDRTTKPKHLQSGSQMPNNLMPPEQGKKLNELLKGEPRKQQALVVSSTAFEQKKKLIEEHFKTKQGQFSNLGALGLAQSTPFALGHSSLRAKSKTQENKPTRKAFCR